jgi:hypothetical protein
VTPGKTSAFDAFEILGKSPIISGVRMHGSGSPLYGGIDWDWATGGPGGSAYFDVQIPEHTIIWAQLGLPPFALRDVIRAYGEPSHVVARHRENVQAMETGRAIYDLHFVYLSYGFVLSEDNLEVKPLLAETEVFAGLTVFAPTLQGFTGATGIPPEFLSAWKGFKSYDSYCIDEWTSKPCE